ncbi:MAG: hypothetical protein R2932_36220 [Caldilineaceae bacterium]
MLTVVLFGVFIALYVLYFSLRRRSQMVYVLAPVLGSAWAYAFTEVNAIESSTWRWITVAAIGLLHLQGVIIMLHLLKKVES